MVKVTFVQASGDERTIEVPTGQSLMEAAQASGIAGIVADCGGNCSCGTCRVFVRADWFGIVGEPNEMEAEMLEMHAEHPEGERLSCQVPLTDELDGLIVDLPHSQF